MLEYCAFPTLQALVAVGFLGLPRLRARAQYADGSLEITAGRKDAIVQVVHERNSCTFIGLKVLAVASDKVLCMDLREQVVEVIGYQWALSRPQKVQRMADYYEVPPEWL